MLKNTTVSETATINTIQWRSRIYAIVGLVLLLVIVTIATLAIGSTDIPFDTLCYVLFDKLPFTHMEATWTSNVETIIFDIRLPRLLLAGLVGAALAVAGATYQGLFRNPLADPYLIGVAQGAALGAVIGFMLPVSWQVGSIPLLAFIGALSAVAVVYSIARVGKTLPMTTLILAGVALGAFLAAITSYLMIASGDKLRGIISWLLGTFSLTGWWQVAIVAPYIVIGTIIIWLYARPLNVMQLDEEQAKQLGVNVEQVKMILLGAA
ncbi:MAG: iron ABC transporter permease, partial [Chloroflexota bacterium]